MTRRRKHTYPGLEDPRAALAELASTYAYVIQLQRRFHVSHPAHRVLAAINGALRTAALELANDPYFFGLGLASQGPASQPPPPAPPIPGTWPPIVKRT